MYIPARAVKELLLSKSSKIDIPQPQFHHRGSAASAQLEPAELNHYRCQMASEHFQEGLHSETRAHDPPASREESIQ